MTDARDRTFDLMSLYGSSAWTAARLGISKDDFSRKRAALEAAGFPKRDPITGLILKEAVDRWANRMLPSIVDFPTKPESKVKHAKL